MSSSGGRTSAGVESVFAPFDNDQDERVAGLYGELVQTLIDERLVLRGGARYTYGETTSLQTAGRTGLVRNTETYDQVTTRLGASYQSSPALRLRAGYATGFRSPTATELAADFVTVAGNQVLGNANLDSETSRQLELGMNYLINSLHLDLALFENRITDRIINRAQGTAPGGRNIGRYANNSDDVVVRGLDMQLEYDVLQRSSTWQWTTFVNATWHFDMQDRGANPQARTDKPERIYEYQGTLGTRLGQDRWDVALSGILRGPMWYNTEERLLIPAGEPERNYVHRKQSFWV